MTKVLLKHVGNKSKNYQKDVANISKIAISVRAKNTPKAEMYSKQELCSKTGGKIVINKGCVPVDDWFLFNGRNPFNGTDILLVYMGTPSSI